MLARGRFLDVALIIVGQTSCLAGLDYVWMPLDASNLFVSAAYHGRRGRGRWGSQHTAGEPDTGGVPETCSIKFWSAEPSLASTYLN
jgi:hypothetical protein